MAKNPFQTKEKQPDYRLPAHIRGYDSAWHKLRNVKLRQDPLCAECARQGKEVAATEVHHIDGNQRNNDYCNLESLCRSCHEKTKRR